MTALIIDGVELSQTSAAELLALGRGSREPDEMSDDDALTELHLVLVQYHCDLAECLNVWLQRYVEDPLYTAARMTRCVVIAARLMGVTP
jgi:hypothetical protein